MLKNFVSTGCFVLCMAVCGAVYACGGSVVGGGVPLEALASSAYAPSYAAAGCNTCAQQTQFAPVMQGYAASYIPPAQVVIPQQSFAPSYQQTYVQAAPVLAAPTMSYATVAAAPVAFSQVGYSRARAVVRAPFVASRAVARAPLRLFAPRRSVTVSRSVVRTRGGAAVGAGVAVPAQAIVY